MSDTGVYVSFNLHRKSSNVAPQEQNSDVSRRPPVCVYTKASFKSSRKQRVCFLSTDLTGSELVDQEGTPLRVLPAVQAVQFSGHLVQLFISVVELGQELRVCPLHRNNTKHRNVIPDTEEPSRDLKNNTYCKSNGGLSRRLWTEVTRDYRVI